MKAKSGKWINISILFVFLLSACVGAQPGPTAQPTLAANQVLTALPQPATGTPAAPKTSTPVSSSGPMTQAATQAVVTATGMAELGPLLNNLPEKSETNPVIDWDQHFKSEQWDEKPCLYDAGKTCHYAQTSVDGSFDLKDFSDMPFTVPNGYYLVAGTFKGSLELGSGFSEIHSDGFLFALSPNTVVESLYLKDGFMVVVPAGIARGEFCARLQQAVDHDWARDWNYGDDAWGEHPCEGLEDLVVPLDSDRIP